MRILPGRERERETERQQRRERERDREMIGCGGWKDGREYLYYSEAKQEQSESGQ